MKNYCRIRNNVPPKWDPILEATSCWFSWKMLTSNAEEKTVLVHLVLEASANVFLSEADKMMNCYGETSYFKIHSDADEKHEKMGIDLLENLTEREYRCLSTIQHQGWDMINAACARMAFLCQQIS